MTDTIMHIINNVLISGLIMGGIFALISVGLSLQYGVGRIMNVAHGEFIMVGAFIAWMLFTGHQVNPFFSLIIAGPFLFLLGYLLHRTLFKKLKDSSPTPAAFEGSSILLAFGILYLIQSIAMITWGASIEGYVFMAYSIHLGRFRFSAIRLTIALFAVALCIIFYLFLTHTRLGKAIRASAQDPVAAGLMGVDINRMLALCFGLGSSMAGIAGVLLSMAFQIQTTMGLQYTIIAIIVVVLGGLGSIPGSLIGGFILGLIGAIVINVEPGLTMAAYYVLFMALLLVKPTGILGR